MSIGELLTRWTIRAALVLYVAVTAGSLWWGPLRSLPPGSPWPPVSRVLWTAGCGLLLAHMAAAFHYYHHWSHADAAADTLRQTQEQVGVAFGGGIYFNYALALLWFADVGWWWIAPAAYARRPNWISFALHAYMLFMAVNGTIVFAEGPTRWWGLVTCLLLAVLVARRYVLGQSSKEAA